MTAAEKLKALNAMHYDEDEDRVCMSCLTSYTLLDRKLTPLSDALPQIVAVVEAAEQARDAMAIAFTLKPKMDWARLRDALDDLSEALE